MPLEVISRPLLLSIFSPATILPRSSPWCARCMRVHTLSNLHSVHPYVPHFVDIAAHGSNFARPSPHYHEFYPCVVPFRNSTRNVTLLRASPLPRRFVESSSNPSEISFFFFPFSSFFTLGILEHDPLPRLRPRDSLFSVVRHDDTQRSDCWWNWK